LILERDTGVKPVSLPWKSNVGSLN